MHGSHFLIRDTAGNNVIKIIKIGIYVEGKAVHGDPAAAAYAHGAYFTGFGGAFRFQAYTGLTGRAPGRDAEIRHGKGARLCQGAQVAAQVGKEMLQVQYGVAYNLARPVKGNVSSPVGRYKADGLLLQLLLIDQEVFDVTAFTKGIY